MLGRTIGVNSNLKGLAVLLAIYATSFKTESGMRGRMR